MFKAKKRGKELKTVLQRDSVNNIDIITDREFKKLGKKLVKNRFSDYDLQQIAFMTNGTDYGDLDYKTIDKCINHIYDRILSGTMICVAYHGFGPDGEISYQGPIM